MRLGVDTCGTNTCPRNRALARAGAGSSKSARSVALGISSANDGAAIDTLVLVTALDAAVGVDVVGAGIEVVAATTRVPAALLVIVSPTPVSISILVVVVAVGVSILFSGLRLRLALRVSRTPGDCSGAVTVCLPFCGDTSRCAPFSAGTGAVDLPGRSIRLTISVSILFSLSACSVCFDCIDCSNGSVSVSSFSFVVVVGVAMLGMVEVVEGCCSNSATGLS